jgi:phenylalanyl-tRNA synthetase beta chain
LLSLCSLCLCGRFSCSTSTRGPSIPDGTKSLAFAQTDQADDRTLTDKEVDKTHKKIEDRLVHVLNRQIRGK